MLLLDTKGWFSLPSAYDLVKIKGRSRKRSYKLDRIGVGRIKTFPFSSDSTYDSVAYYPVKTRLSKSEAEAEEPTNSQCLEDLVGIEHCDLV